MTDILAQPEQFKAELKNKWLDYYQANRSWLQHYMDENSGWSDSVNYDEEELENYGVDEDYEPRRPECYFILGVASVLEPSLKGLFSFAGNLNTNSEKLVKTFGLDFDPELELKKRSQQTTNQTIQTDS
jgi:hypothetical protein